MFRFLYFWTLLKHFKSATEILSRFQIYQIISFSFAPELSFCFNLGYWFSKLTNYGCHPERFFFCLYWMQFTGSLVFLLGFIPMCWEHFQRKESWEINFLRSYMSENVFFLSHTLEFGYKANLGKLLFHAESWRFISQSLQASGGVTDKSEAILIHNPVCPYPTPTILKLQWFLNGAFEWIFFHPVCCEHLKDPLNLQTTALQYCKIFNFLPSAFSRTPN